MLLADWEIRALCCPGLKDGPMLEPYSEACDDEGIIPYGLTSAGYDLRLGYTALIFKNSYNETVSPIHMKDDKEGYSKRIFDEHTVVHTGTRIIVPPNGYILGYTVEYIRMPRMLKGRCVGKSTIARCGIIINTTPIEPEWEGYLTLEIANSTPCPVEVYAGWGIAQMEVERINGIVEKSYKDKKGRYDKQGARPVPGVVR